MLENAIKGACSVLHRERRRSQVTAVFGLFLTDKVSCRSSNDTSDDVSLEPMYVNCLWHFPISCVSGVFTMSENWASPRQIYMLVHMSFHECLMNVNC